MTNTPENMLKFAKTLEQDQSTKNTFKVLFGDPVQRKAIEDMNRAAQLGLIEPASRQGLQLQTISSLKQAGAVTAAGLGGYYFVLTPEQQEKLKENFGPALASAGGMILSQRALAKALLDPKGARAVSFLSKAKEQALSPTAFTKVVVEPLYNILSGESFTPETFFRSEFDVTGLPVRSK
jgi:hypothetical protein